MFDCCKEMADTCMKAFKEKDKATGTMEECFKMMKSFLSHQSRKRKKKMDNKRRKTDE
jgi:hypothetical protein